MDYNKFMHDVSEATKLNFTQEYEDMVIQSSGMIVSVSDYDNIIHIDLDTGNLDIPEGAIEEMEIDEDSMIMHIGELQLIISIS